MACMLPFAAFLYPSASDQDLRDPSAVYRIFQAVVACTLLFIGIVMQLWSGTNVDNIPLSVNFPFLAPTC